MGDYIGLDAEWTYAQVLPKGAPVEIKDWDDDELSCHSIHISDGEMGVLIGGSREQLVELLESALQQAWSLPEG